MNSLKLTLSALAVMSLTACASSNPAEPKLDYQSPSAPKEVSLAVPPDLTTPNMDPRYVIPQGAVTATQIANAGKRGQQVTGNPALLPQVKDIHIERDGAQRWLAIDNKTADEIWPQLKQFWQEMGFVMASEEPQIGLMQTEWAENRAKLPNDGLRKLFEKVGLGNVYSTSERDQFVIRMERSNNGVNVFFGHKGMEEVYDSKNKDTTVWQPRPSDPNLEAALLGRFMMYLGLNEEQVSQQLAQNDAPTGSLARIVGNTVELQDSGERAYRRVGLALDRVGLTVIQENRERALYLVKPADLEADAIKTDKPGVFTRWFGKKQEAVVEEKPQLIVSVVPTSQGTSAVTILNEDGSPYQGKDANTFLSRLQTELR
ncbi:MAG: outer membrane protein assembly factor BamC [Neisseriaceae bacterium]|nr:outer membrane protein assembly factor BamC [Neisseriaceae bacterium]MBP6861866.1 outer membrane protein assembly factor BamC [Neisseriaceae bacterium]